MKQVEVEELATGDVGLIAGSNKYEIGDTVVNNEEIEAIDRIEVEEPTMRMIFSINTSPGSGTEGKAIQSRELRERLENECRANPALRMEDTEVADQIYLLGRGELQFGIIIETMRREGLEFMVGRPNVLMKKDEETGEQLEPFEKIILDVPEENAGDVTTMYQQRKGVLASYEALPGSETEPRVRLAFDIPTRGVLGTNSKFLTATRGAGLISSRPIGYKLTWVTWLTDKLVLLFLIEKVRQQITLNMIQQRGQLFIGTGSEVYEGMIVGGVQENDLNVHVCRPKKLTNVRSSGSDGIIQLNGTKT